MLHEWHALAVLSQVRLKDSAKDSNLAHALRSLQGTVVDFVIEDSEENDNNADADRAEWLTELSQTRRCEHEK